jgi:anti-sigma B factor antagonist
MGRETGRAESHGHQPKTRHWQERKGAEWADCLKDVGRLQAKNGDSMCVDHSISTWADGDVLVVQVAGELGLGALPCFRAALRRAEGASFTLVVIEGSRLEFLDAAGLGALIGGQRRLRDQGTEVQLINPTRPVRRLLELVGFDRSVGLRRPDFASLARGTASSRSGAAGAERRLAANFSRRGPAGRWQPAGFEASQHQGARRAGTGRRSRRVRPLLCPVETARGAPDLVPLAFHQPHLDRHAPGRKVAPGRPPHDGAPRFRLRQPTVRPPRHWQQTWALAHAAGSRGHRHLGFHATTPGGLGIIEPA